MKKYVTIVAALTLGWLSIVIPVSATNRVTASLGDKPPLWSSSAPVPEGAQVEIPPDRPTTIDGADASPAQSYNAFLRISGAALKPRESDVEWYGAGGGGCIYASSGNLNAVFNTPVYLPQGATVKYMRLYYNDTNASTNSTAWFTVYDLYGQLVLEKSASSTGGSGTGYATTLELTHTVNYESYSYVVNWRPNELGNDMQVCGFRIYYHTPPDVVYLPIVIKN